MNRLRFRKEIFVFALACSPALAFGEQAKPADAFVDAIGVNTHVHFNDTAYNDFPKVKAALLDLGIRHLRDGLVDSSWQPYYDRLNELGRAGVHAQLICGVPSRYNENYQPPHDRIMPTLAKLADSVEAIEGTNEPDLNHRDGADWSAMVREHQKAIFTLVKADPTFGKLPVVGPSICFSNQPQVGDLAAYLDYGNSHPYPGGRTPSINIDQELAKQKVISGAKPMMVTETGYQTAVTTTDGHLPASEAAEAKYLPRLFCEYFNRGVVRTFDYQLVDGTAGDPADVETHFGLLHADFKPRPAYAAMKNLIGLLSDKGRTKAGDLDFTLTAPGGGKLSESIHHTLLRKSDGDYFLLVWNEVPSWDVDKRADLKVDPVPAVLKPKTPPARAILWQPSTSRQPLRKLMEPDDLKAIRLNVPDEVLIVQLMLPK